MLCKPCFSWKRCKHRKPCPVRRSTHAGASAGGGDGVPFTEPKKTFAGQQSLHSPGVAAARFGPRWNLPSFTPPCFCYSKAWKWIHPTGLGWNLNRAEEIWAAGCQSNKGIAVLHSRDRMARIWSTVDMKRYFWVSCQVDQLKDCSTEGIRIWLADHFTTDSPGWFFMLSAKNKLCHDNTAWWDSKSWNSEKPSTASPRSLRVKRMNPRSSLQDWPNPAPEMEWM